MEQSTFDRSEAARLLRELAAELLDSEGPARNGLFLELHRLQDTIFRMTLESHPDAPPELAAQAFALSEPLPAPQVVRELHRLSPSMITGEIHNLYKHMNAARNNMAHEAVIGRLTVSRSNCKRMARLARLLAVQLDPDAGEKENDEKRSPQSAPRRVRLPSLLLWCSGTLMGIPLGWTLWQVRSTPLLICLAVVAVVSAGAAWWLDSRAGG